MFRMFNKQLWFLLKKNRLFRRKKQTNNTKKKTHSSHQLVQNLEFLPFSKKHLRTSHFFQPPAPQSPNHSPNDQVTVAGCWAPPSGPRSRAWMSRWPPPPTSVPAPSPSWPKGRGEGRKSRWPRMMSFGWVLDEFWMFEVDVSWGLTGMLKLGCMVYIKWILIGFGLGFILSGPVPRRLSSAE